MIENKSDVDTPDLKKTIQIATNCWMCFSFISRPGPLAITSPRSITKY
jgi:hypothetical protein